MALLGCTELYWDVLGGNGLYLAALDCTGQCWAVLGESSGFGKYSSRLLFQLFSWCFCLCLCLFICVPLPFLMKCLFWTLFGEFLGTFPIPPVLMMP